MNMEMSELMLIQEPFPAIYEFVIKSPERLQ